MKAEVLSWQTSTERIAELKAEARRRRISVSALLDRIVADWLAQHRRRLIVVAPTSHLKVQWSLAAHRLGLQLDPDWTPEDREFKAKAERLLKSLR